MLLNFFNQPVPSVLVRFSNRASIPTHRIWYYIIIVLALICTSLAYGQTQPLPKDQTVRIQPFAPPPPGPAIPVFPVDPSEKATSHSWDYQQQQKKKVPDAPTNLRPIFPEGVAKP